MAERRTIIETLAALGATIPVFGNWLAQNCASTDGMPVTTNFVRAIEAWGLALGHRTDDIVRAGMVALITNRTSKDGPYPLPGDLVVHCDLVEFAGEPTADQLWGEVIAEKNRIANVVGYGEAGERTLRFEHADLIGPPLEAIGGFGAVLYADEYAALAAAFRREYDASRRRARDLKRMPPAVAAVLARSADDHELGNEKSHEVGRLISKLSEARKP